MAAIPGAFVRPSQILREVGHPVEHVRKEPREPDAFPFSGRAHQVHPVVPVTGADQGEPVGTGCPPPYDRPLAMFKERGALEGHSGQLQAFVLLLFQLWRLHEPDHLMEDSHVAGDPHAMRGHVGEPEKIIGNPRANSRAAWQMPPVLDVPLRELPAGCEQDMVPGQSGLCVHKRHHILQLIAEPESPSRLVKA